jgi:hypothetical protein
MSKNKNHSNGLEGRDPESGRFLVGNSGNGGRGLGSRNKLGEAFVADLHDAWLTHGKDVIERVVRDDPAQFLKTISHVLPKQLEAEITTNVNLFARVENVNTAYKLALDFINGKIAADDEVMLIETNNGQHRTLAVRFRHDRRPFY